MNNDEKSFAYVSARDRWPVIIVSSETSSKHLPVYIAVLTID